jgi:hypothetical protein
MGLADDVAAIRRMWKARTGKAPDAQMDAVIRDVAQNITDTNEGRFDFIVDFFISGPDGGAFQPSRTSTGTGGGVRAQPFVFTPSETLSETPNQGPGSLVLDEGQDDLPKTGGGVSGPVETPAAEPPTVDVTSDVTTGAPELDEAANEKIADVIQDYEDTLIDQQEAMVRLYQIYLDAGFPESVAQNYATSAINTATVGPIFPQKQVDGIVKGYVDGLWERGTALTHIIQTILEAGFDKEHAESRAHEALDAVDKGYFASGGTTVSAGGPVPVDPTDPGEAGFISSPAWWAAMEQSFADEPQNPFAFDTPAFAFDRFLNTQDFGGRSLGQLNPAAQQQIRGEFQNRLSQFALFGAGVPTAGGEPIYGEPAFTQFLGQDVPTAEALTGRLQLLRDIRARDVDESAPDVSAAEGAFLEGYFFDINKSEQSQERVMRAGLQPTLVSSASPYFNEAFTRGAETGFKQWLAENPTLSFLDYAQEIGLF